MKILFITLSNIGDVILTLPAMDILRRDFPEAQFTVLCSEKAADIFRNDPQVELLVFDKRASIKDYIRLTLALRKECFDWIFDFRNTAFPWLLRSQRHTSAFIKIPKDIVHKKGQHLFRLRSIYPFAGEAAANSIFIEEKDRQFIADKLGVLEGRKLVVISAGAANEWKCWTEEGFAVVADWLIEEYAVAAVLVGDEKDRESSGRISEKMRNRPLNLSAETSLKQLAVLLSKADLVISNDSAVMHLASYLNVPVVALFGPSNEKRYGPWSRKRFVVRSNVSCAPCEKSGCDQEHDCMRSIPPLQVIKVLKENFSELKVELPAARDFSKDRKRILLVRTDRIGDVLLTTPVLKALKEFWPYSYVAMLIAPQTREIVEGNPYLDEVMVFDKQKGWRGFWGMVRKLRSKHFDLALVLHTKRWTNLLCFLSGIKERVGYHNNKFGFLLTQKIPDTRPQGKMHEAEYCLAALSRIGIPAQYSPPFMPISSSAEIWADEVLKSNGVARKDLLIALNPGASCPSKRWREEKWAILARRLSEKLGAKIAIICGSSDMSVAQEVLSRVSFPVIDLAGKTSLKQLASFLRRANLFITNDSGPMHIACAVNTPVVAVFGRNEKGLSPRRWGPWGKLSTVLHKEVGCELCLAHNCQKGFACLEAISPEEVLTVAEQLLSSSR
ncbi:MAG: lipopolysaccharide heptosyltransferase II [Candidatus Omnitrophota bacterium]